MEEDRAQTNLGEGQDAELESLVTGKPKQPKKRFVGRKAAERAGKQPHVDGTIEDSGAVQGMQLFSRLPSAVLIEVFPSCAATTTSSTFEPSTPRDPERRRHQRGHFAPSFKLQFRNPQDNPSDPYIWV